MEHRFGSMEYTNKAGSTRSVYTMETDDVTNEEESSNSSSSSGLLGASLDLDVHGFGTTTNRTTHIRRSFNNNASQEDGFGESFMLEDSFAMGESFTCYDNDNGWNDASGTTNHAHQRRSATQRERLDISSILVIEEEEEIADDINARDKNDDVNDSNDERCSMRALERQARKMTLKSQTSNISVETH